MPGTELFSLSADSDDGGHFPVITRRRPRRIDTDIPGSRRTVSPKAAPIQLVKTERAKDGGEKPLWVYANIRPEHLKTGEETDANGSLTQKIIKRGVSDHDNCGFIIGPNFGGKMAEYNLFPQDRTQSKGIVNNYRLWKLIHYNIWLWLTLMPQNSEPNVEFEMRLYYNDDAHPDRPTHFKYSVGFFQGRENQEEGLRCQIAQTVFKIALGSLESVNEASIEKFKQNLNLPFTGAMKHLGEGLEDVMDEEYLRSAVNFTLAVMEFYEDAVSLGKRTLKSAALKMLGLKGRPTFASGLEYIKSNL